ncbi:hypothetical protein N8J89_31130 [Crossiella sp. CA-258035]|uniref:hypothetical protein n=1 Tax=Crossiella sp. CA-258035 TaxID=2981138 RepID=UPI0024BCE1F6|nr:hypothetical protein [Crossiella sp. CA-258035]WHT17549.1 hypothetical protein N8J89_31130 [Crossiella sp. CA-258035]
MPIALVTGAVAFLAVVAVVTVVAVRGQQEVTAGETSSVASTALTTTPTAYRTAEPSLTTGWTPTTTGRPTTVTISASDDVPVGYRRVAGPERIRVVIPVDWPVSPGAMPSSQQADSPTNRGDLLRFGGSDSAPGSLLQSVAGNETDNSGIRQGYQRLRLERVSSTSAVVETVEWEFLYDKDGGRKHAMGRFWRLNGIDYVVYASASVATWPTVKPIFDVLASTAGPMA